MPAPVKLPSGPLIHYWKFCRLIAEALQPINKNPKGIDCVEAKSYPAGVPSPYAGTDVPHDLDEADRQELAKVLPKLPPLKYPMSEEDIASFTEAYAKLPNRPMWVPVLVTKDTILGRKIKHDQIMDRHIAAIRKECRAGRLVPVDANHVPLEAVEIGAHLSRKDAIAYLEQHGLAYDDEDARKSPGSEIKSSTTVGKAKLSQSDRELLPQRRAKLVAEGVRNPTEQLAKELGVSTSRIRALIREAKATEPSPPSLARAFFNKRG
ncbi:hypothetical protein J6358_12475 [Burkholderia pseudomallei]|uniref:hypothetical protein n=1 Tax=Burkholderia pseudomallei TaxID=28450 RepID=UPI001AD7CDFA|nr:hypothetical protein [Burkholderia pseudomallei]MBO7930560.1 hypothetical protein [Burkholderia pseudomallei]